MTTAILSPLLKQRFMSDNNLPLYQGQLWTYSAGTTTPVATYTDSTAGTENTNPIVLDARGECNCWVTPNIAYKFVLKDANGNTIWTIDDVINQQLITLYGGVDTGIVNGYILDFTASFQSYADGIVIYWIPSHGNTGPSTINVNGLGVVSIINQNGTPLGPNQIFANLTTIIMYRGGQFYLISSGNSAQQTGDFDLAVFGVSSGAFSGNYRINGTVCTLRLVGSGVSDADTFTATGLPAAAQPSIGGTALPAAFVDNGASVLGWVGISAGSGALTFGIGVNDNPSGWTASGNKGFVSATVSYLLS